MKLKIIFGLGLLCIILIVSCQSDEQMEFNRYYAAGRVIYQTKCQNCHGNNGEGLLALMPPLTDSVYLEANKQELACMVKYGQDKTLRIAGKSFDGKMPGNDLPPVDIAEVLTYVGNSFGNKLGVITSQQVEDNLSKCR